MVPVSPLGSRSGALPLISESNDQLDNRVISATIINTNHLDPKVVDRIYYHNLARLTYWKTSLTILVDFTH